MASSLSSNQYGNVPLGGSSAGGFGAQDAATSAPLNANLFKSLSEKRATQEVNPPKRRGPKPDSKPALTRRQELNRQAQRTHRERKEQYIKALEDEVFRLKELYSAICRDKDQLVVDNKQLRDALAQHGIPYSGNGVDELSSNQGYSNVSASSPGVSYSTASRTAASPSTAPSVMSSGYVPPLPGSQMSRVAHPANNKGMDMDQAGIDFVLAYDRSASSRAYLSPPPQ